MKVRVISIPVSDQEKALKFYTEVLGFVKKVDQATGGGNRWLTVVSPDDLAGPEILLEPAPVHFEPAKVYQKALYDAGIPYTQFAVNDIKKEQERLTKLGVEFTMKPTNVGAAIIGIIDDTNGNKIQLVELLS